MAKDPEHIGELKRALGQRLADLRKAAAVTQQDLARHTFVDRTYVSHAERGQQMPTERSFWVAADEYLGANGCLRAAFDEMVAAQHQAKQSELDALRARHQLSIQGCRAAISTEIIGWLSATMLAGRRRRPAGEVVSPDGDDRVEIGVLKDRVRRAWQFRQQANYVALGGHLAQLIPDIEASAVALAGDERCEVLRLKVHTYNAASSLLKRLGDSELALLAADRAVRTAHLLDDPLLTAAADYRLGNVLLEAGRFDDTRDVVLHAADTVDPGKTAGPLGLASWGGLLLTAAVASVRKGDACHAWELLGEARMASRLLGSEYADIHTIFGPTNVAIYSVQVAAELGNGHDAVRRGKQVDVEHLPASLRERRGQFLIDLAQGHVLLGSDEVATETLLRAENIAPEEVRFNPTAHRLVHTMLGRERMGAISDLRGLAQRVGVER
jgi:transcriptional regulator with XRE-family HTH domain